MKKYIIHAFSFLLLLMLIFGSYRVSFAHGQPVITVSPTNIAPGDKITVTGSEMEANEVFTITLEGMAGTIKLGEATAVVATGEEDGGFEATFTIPSDTAPGPYTIKAATDGGEDATTDLTITAATDLANSESTSMQEPSSAPHIIDRSKPLAEKIGVGIAALASALLGVIVLRIRE